MGKIKVRTLGTDQEVIQKNKAKQKGKEKSASRRMVKGGKGGERVVSVGPSEKELQAVIVSEANQSQTGKPKAEKRQAKRTTKI